MRAVILGGNGMLGHKLWQIFNKESDTFVLARKPYTSYHDYGIFDSDRWISGIDARDIEGITKILKDLNPHIVINCIGIVKQLPEAEDPLLAIRINSLFPHYLANICKIIGSRLIHISTDCVFSGRTGMYKEEEIPDPVDLYGRSKLLGEIQGENCLTIRTSFIGRELGTHNGLVEWLLNTKYSRVNGYINAIFSGLTSEALARILLEVVSNHRSLSGIYHVSSEPISKYDLLQRLREAYELEIEIAPFKDYCCNRSLDSSRFRAASGIMPPSWDEMIQGLSNDNTRYDI